MKCLILYLLLIDIICAVFSNNDAYNCLERQNLLIALNNIPSLLKNFTICFMKCLQSKTKDEPSFMIASQLKSSISVLKELYYLGQIHFQVCITLKFNSLIIKLTKNSIYFEFYSVDSRIE